MTKQPKKPTTHKSIGMDSANFPTFKISVPAPTKPTATSLPKAPTQVSSAKPKDSK